jgi:hypothetical protein
MRFSLVIVLLCCSAPLLAQKKDDIPEFGKITKAELQMSECDFDKNAEAVVLFDEEKVNFKIHTYSLYSEISRHIRIKILKNKGLGRANIGIFFYSAGKQRASIILTHKHIILMSGNIVTAKLDNKSVFSKEINKRMLTSRTGSW